MTADPQLAAIIDRLDVGLARYRLTDAALTAMNARFAALAGITEGEAVTLDSLIDHLFAGQDERPRLPASGEACQPVHWDGVFRRGGPERYLRLRILLLPEDVLACVLTDVTERQRVEEQLAFAVSVFENSSEAIMITDAANNIVSVNKAFTEVTGYAAEEVTGHPPRILSSGRQDAAFYRQMWDCLTRTGTWRGEIWNRRKNGEIYAEWLCISTIRDAKGRITHHVAIFSDITERKAAEERVRYLAHYDFLTGLPNRMLLSDRTESALRAARRHGGRVAVLFLDLDKFKPVNDTLGHDAGDQLLQQVAERLKDCVRESDTVSRLGGDEFVLLLSEVKELEDAGAVAEKVITAIGYPFILRGCEVSIGTSIGIALFPDHGEDPQTLFKRADAAMYRVKETQRGRYRYYQEGDDRGEGRGS